MGSRFKNLGTSYTVGVYLGKSIFSGVPNFTQNLYLLKTRKFRTEQLKCKNEN
jgi:hypothetical protein